MRPFLSTLLLLCLVALPGAAQTGKNLQIYYIDTEGGLSTLYVSPSGESLLVDTGSAGDRDLDRILAVIKDAGIKQIDYLVLTHFHPDHFGNLLELVKRIPVKHFIDHGSSVEKRQDAAIFEKNYPEIYAKAARTVAKPGDRIPLPGVNVLVVTSAGQVLKKPVVGAGKPNAACADFKPRDESNVDPDNAQSIGLLFTYGKFKTINLGDFTWNAEKDLMCPNNPIGTVDLYLTSHHGTDQSGSPALVWALAPRVAIMHNGPRKGGAVQTFEMLERSPGLEDLWQLHWAYAGGIEHNAPGVFIANMDDPATIAGVLTAPPPPPPTPGGRGNGGRGRGPGAGSGHVGPANWIKVSAQQDGTFTVLNSRNNFSKTYLSPK